MSIWALVTTQVLFIAKVAKATLDPTQPNLLLIILSLLTTILHLIIMRFRTTIRSLLIIIRNLPTTITMNPLIILVVVLSSPKDLAVDS